MRASTLGLAITDLSFDYCWTAIWADIEVYIGIIAANLSLVRMYYGWFRDSFRVGRGTQETLPGTIEAGPYPLSPHSEPKSTHSMQIRGRQSRRDSDTASEESELPFGIAREMQYSIKDGTSPIDSADGGYRPGGYRTNQTTSLPKTG